MDLWGRALTTARRIEPGLVALFAAALALRLFRLDAEPLWFDEAFTALTSPASIGYVAETLQQEGNAPFHYFLIHFWVLAFGDSEFSLRLPSALAGAAAVPLLFAVGARMFSRQAGWLAAVLAVASPLHVHFSQEARMYPMVALCGLWILSAANRLFRKPCRRSAIPLAVALTFGIYLHYYFLLLLPMLGLAVLTADPKRTSAYAGLALGLASIGFAPWLTTFIAQARSPVTAS